jgi:putative transposase
MNAIRSFDAGTIVEINGRSFRSEGRGPGGRLKLRHSKTGNIQYLTPERVNELMLDGRARLLPSPELATLVGAPPAANVPLDLAALPKEEQDATLRRYEYVNAIWKAGLPALTAVRMADVIEATRLERGDATAPNWRTVVRWVRQYERSRCVLALVHEARGNSYARLPAGCIALMEVAVDTKYLTEDRHTLDDTQKHLSNLIVAENALLPPEDRLPKVSYRALRRYVARLDKFEVMARRMGEAYARRWFRAYGRGAIATRPLEIVQVDHTILDVEVAYQGLLRLGRPTITVVLDTYTRMILSIETSFEPASYLCVMDALRSAILPKDELIARMKAAGLVRNDWPAFGVPTTLLLDNGKEFRGNDLRNAAAHFGMDLRFAPPRAPWFKGAIERFLSTLRNGLVSMLPARTFGVREEKGEDRDTSSAIDLDDLRSILIKWVVDVYHQSPHSTNGLPPMEMWNQAMRGNKWF